ncbi:MAG: tripartite tricarboxylate transporter permease [Deinococcota bacterium]
METLGLLLDGFQVALQPLNLLLAFAGVLIGTIVGMLPGIGPINGIAVLIPVTFALNLPAASALILFSGIYYGAQYGNSISTILINVPGTPASVVTGIDGYAMTKQGRAGPALAMSAVASFFGGTVSVIALMLFAPLLAQWAIRFGPAEYFALMVFALTMLSSLTSSSFAKALISTVFGLMLSTVGYDRISAVPRYTFGNIRLLDGMDFVVVTIGFFAISEIIEILEKYVKNQDVDTHVGRVLITVQEFTSSLWTMIRGAVIGFFVGVLPGAGSTIATFVTYATEKRFFDAKGELGTGAIRGVASPEAANNAAANGAFIPLLTLGVPGSGTTAIILGALLGLNITPGPLFIQNQPEVFWGLIASMYIGNIMLLVLNLPLVGMFVRILQVPQWFLLPAVAGISFIAVYAVNNSVFDLILMTIFGVIGYAMRKTGFPLAPVILGLVLGPLMESNLRRALNLSQGDWRYLVSSPLSIAIWVLVVVSLLLPFVMVRIQKRVTSVKDEPAES